MARPSILTPEVIERVCQELRLGMPIRQACAAIPMSEGTYYEWRQRREEGGLFLQFFQDTDEAIEAGLRSLAVVVRKGAQKDPKLALEVLARRDHQNWGRRNHHTVDAKVQHTGNVLHRATDEQLSAVLAKLGIEGEDE